MLLSISVELAITAGAGGEAVVIGTLSNVNREAVALIGELDASALTFSTELAGEFDPESSSSTTSFIIPLRNEESPAALFFTDVGVIRPALLCEGEGKLNFDPEDVNGTFLALPPGDACAT